MVSQTGARVVRSNLARKTANLATSLQSYSWTWYGSLKHLTISQMLAVQIT